MVADGGPAFFTTGSARGEKYGAGRPVRRGSGPMAGKQHRSPLSIGFSADETARLAATQPVVDERRNQRSGSEEIARASAGADGEKRGTGRSVITPSRTRKVR